MLFDVLVSLWRAVWVKYFLMMSSYTRFMVRLLSCDSEERMAGVIDWVVAGCNVLVYLEAVI